MTCSETHEFLFAFLDNELDAPLSIELQRHLERCHECAREVEIERTVRKHLAIALEGQAASPSQDGGTGVSPLSLHGSVSLHGPEARATRGQARATRGFEIGSGQPPFEEDTLRDILAADAVRLRRGRAPARRSRRFRPRLRGVSGVVGIAAALVIGVSAWIWLRPAVGREKTAQLADLVAADFAHFVEAGRPVQFVSPRPEAVARWLRSRTKLAVVLPSLDGRGVELIGGRKCKIAGRTTAFAVYELDGVTASLVVVNGEGFDIGRMQRVERDGRTHWVGRARRHTVVACRRGELLYATVSTLPETQLLHLMPGLEHEGD